MELAASRSLRVVEDCAQSLGTTYQGRATGTFGDVGCFSFYPTKNLGAYGDGGLCFTRDQALHDAMRQSRSYGCGASYYAEREGVCSRLDEIQAAILNVKLTRLPECLRQRRLVSRWYDETLAPEISRPVPTPGTSHSYQLFVVRVAHRARLTEQLESAGIGYGIHYPTPIHLMTAYRFLGYREGDFPVSERLAEQVVSLPCYPEMSPEMAARVSAVINQHHSS
jgi:dTDP-4-amino-4,6-dideoxygalactose transaminase